MAVFDAPVCFTRAAPLAAYSGQLIFYDVVEPSTVDRCEVLSCIVEAGGEAVLPEDIRLPEFRTWLAAAKATSLELDVMPFSTKCTVLKVADALGDARVDEWINLAAEALREQARDHPHARSGGITPESASQSLLSMPDPLQQRLYATVARQTSQMLALLDFLPAHMHPAVVAATVTPTNTLTVPLYEHSLPVVKALSSMPHESPKVLSLSVVHDPTCYPVGLEPMEAPALQEAALHLVAALMYHSGVSHLRLDLECVEPASVRLLARACATLKSLQSLHLRIHIDPDTARTLQHTLRALPHLQALSLLLRHASPGPQARLRHDSTASAAGADASCSLSDMLTPATQLTSLHLRAHADTDTDCFAATAPLVLPHLRQLNAEYDHFYCRYSDRAAWGASSLEAINLITCLIAPLTFLHLHMNRPLQAEQAPQAQLLFERLAEFRQLKHLRFETPVRNVVTGNAVLAAAPRAFAALHQLERLEVSAPIDVLLEAVPLLRESATGLTGLWLVCLNRSYSVTDDATVTVESWARLAEALSWLPLESLALELEDSAVAPLPGVSALCPHELSQLTALRLAGWPCMGNAADVSALARMTRLQKLHLLLPAGPTVPHRDCVRAMQTLPALTSLLVNALHDDFPAAVVADAAPPHAWPALRELYLGVYDPSCGLAMVDLADTRPQLTRLVLGAEPMSDGEDPESEEVQLWDQLDARETAAGVRVSCDVIGEILLQRDDSGAFRFSDLGTVSWLRRAVDAGT